MKISIDSKYIATVDTSLLGYIGETNARTIEVEQPEVPGADTYKLRLDYGGVLAYEVQIEDGVIPCKWIATQKIRTRQVSVACNSGRRR